MAKSIVNRVKSLIILMLITPLGFAFLLAAMSENAIACIIGSFLCCLCWHAGNAITDSLKSSKPDLSNIPRASDLPLRWIAAIGIFPALLWYWAGQIANMPPWHPPAFQQLEMTTGTLLKGAGGNRYIKTKSGKTLSLICADHSSGRRSSPNNWCLYEHEKPYLGQEVIVYHAHPIKAGLTKARYYEMRSGVKRIVRYEDVARRAEHVSERRRRTSPFFYIFPTIGWLYFLTIAVRRRRKSPHSTPGHNAPALAR